MFSGWGKDNNLFPKPMLEENKVYACRDIEGNEFEARFCYGGGEYWWTDPNTGREVSVAEFSRGAAS